MESEHAVVTEGMIYKAPQKGNLHERKAGQSHFSLKSNRNILWWWLLLRETWIDEKENKSHGTEEVKLVPTSPGWWALFSSTCTCVDLEYTGEPGQWHREIRVKKEADSPCTEEQQSTLEHDREVNLQINCSIGAIKKNPLSTLLNFLSLLLADASGKSD